MTKKVYTEEYKPHPLVSCGTVSEEEKSTPMYKHIKKLVTPIFEKAAQELSKNHMVVGSGRGNKVFYQPHNYKLYFQYSKVSANLPKQDFNKSFKYPTPPSFKYPTPRPRVFKGFVYKWINSGKELSFPDFFNCRVVLKKKQIEITNKINHKAWYPIDFSSDAEEDIKRIIELKDNETLNVLKKFIELFSGSSDLKILNAHSENKVKGEDAINAIPEKMRFHSDLAKKVYGECNVEFPTPAHAANYITARAKEDFLNDRFDELRNDLMNKTSTPLVSSLESIKLDINKFPEDVLKLDKDITLLSDLDKSSLTDWLFNTFGGSSYA